MQIHEKQENLETLLEVIRASKQEGQFIVPIKDEGENRIFYVMELKIEGRHFIYPHQNTFFVDE